MIGLAANLVALSSLLGQAHHSFEVKGGQFLLDGKPFQILAGEIHFARVPHQLWRQRVQMAKAMGLNTVSAYVFWNVQEPEPGRFDFSGDADVAQFIRICQQEGMYVVLRPGPYCCAEWEFGGFPYWLLRDPKLVVRSDNPQFLSASQAYLNRLARETAPLQVTHGGNILMVQVENEYGSYGHDHAYMAKIRDMLRGAGYDVPLYVAEGSGQLADAWVPGTVPGANGAGWPGVKTTVNKYTPGGPYFVPEFYPGWLDHWGEPMVRTGGDVGGYTRLIQNGVSVSMYMFHGGTNFGFMNGANYGGAFQPSITSYDYDAPLSEWGNPAPKYFRFREAIAKVTGRTPPPVPAPPRTISIPRFKLSDCGSLLGSLPNPVTSNDVPTFEDLRQPYGYVLYRTSLMTPGRLRLDLGQVRDYAVVMLDGKTVATLDRRLKQHECDLDVPARGGRLDVFVENGGRINYGDHLQDNRKGLTVDPTLDGKPLGPWRVYRLPMNDPLRMKLDGARRGPTLYRGVFQVEQPGETFLDMRGWSKGEVWVNHHALGRYWGIGPQQTLYLPSVWLHRGQNEIAVLDLKGSEEPSIQGLDKPLLDELHVGKG